MGRVVFVYELSRYQRSERCCLKFSTNTNPLGFAVSPLSGGKNRLSSFERETNFSSLITEGNKSFSIEVPEGRRVCSLVKDFLFSTFFHKLKYGVKTFLCSTASGSTRRKSAHDL
jgi:hypothetical protein